MDHTAQSTPPELRVVEIARDAADPQPADKPCDAAVSETFRLTACEHAHHHPRRGLPGGLGVGRKLRKSEQCTEPHIKQDRDQRRVPGCSTSF